MVRERLEQGRLPAMINGHVKASYGGDGSACDVCASEIEPQHVEYEVAHAPTKGPLLFHLRCYGAWQAECVKQRAKKG
jgi:hypothetical protein